MATNDTLEKITADLRALIDRAYTLGRKAGQDAALERIVAAIQQSPASNKAPTPQSVLPGVSVPETASRIRRRRYPYGMVKETVTKTLAGYPQGATRREIQNSAIISGTQIEEEAIRNTLKVMVRNGEAHVRQGTYFSGPAK